MLGGRVREDAGRVADDDAALARRVEVDVVDPDRVVRDDAELRAGRVEERGVDGDRGRDDDAVRARRAAATSSNDSASSRSISAGTPAAS